MCCDVLSATGGAAQSQPCFDTVVNVETAAALPSKHGLRTPLSRGAADITRQLKTVRLVRVCHGFKTNIFCAYSNAYTSPRMHSAYKRNRAERISVKLQHHSPMIPDRPIQHEADGSMFARCATEAISKPTQSHTGSCWPPQTIQGAPCALPSAARREDRLAWSAETICNTLEDDCAVLCSRPAGHGRR